MGKNDAWLGVRLSHAQHKAIKERAEATGLTVSDYVRIRCTTDPEGPVIKTDVETLRRVHVNLRRAGSNLNQVAKALNTRRRQEDLEDELHEALSAVALASSDISKFIADARRSV